MPVTFATNENNDIFIGPDGNLAIVSDKEAVLQICQNVAKTLLGELIFATDQGIPYLQAVWSGVADIPTFEAALRSAFLGVEGVTQVVSLTTNQVVNTLNYQAVIATIYGEGVITNG